MSDTLKIPKSGMGIAEAEVHQWLVKEGDRFNEGDILVEIETAKAVEEIPAPYSGTLIKILIPEGESAEVDDDIAVLEERIAGES